MVYSRGLIIGRSEGVCCGIEGVRCNRKRGVGLCCKGEDAPTIGIIVRGRGLIVGRSEGVCRGIGVQAGSNCRDNCRFVEISPKGVRIVLALFDGEALVSVSCGSRFN
jgi:hypothetical protein